jgi:hypothetical protein
MITRAYVALRAYVANLRNAGQALRGNGYALACDVEDHLADLVAYSRSRVGFFLRWRAFLLARRIRHGLYRVCFGPKHLWCRGCESIAVYSQPTAYCDLCLEVGDGW